MFMDRDRNAKYAPLLAVGQRRDKHVRHWRLFAFLMLLFSFGILDTPLAHAQSVSSERQTDYDMLQLSLSVYQPYAPKICFRASYSNPTSSSYRYPLSQYELKVTVLYPQDPENGVGTKNFVFSDQVINADAQDQNDNDMGSTNAKGGNCPYLDTTTEGDRYFWVGAYSTTAEHRIIYYSKLVHVYKQKDGTLSSIGPTADNPDIRNTDTATSNTGDNPDIGNTDVANSNTGDTPADGNTDTGDNSGDNFSSGQSVDDQGLTG